MINRERLINEFMSYVQIDSESFDELRFYRHIKQQLIELDFDIIPDSTGEKAGSNCNNLIARRQGSLEGPVLGLCAHLDTVRPGKGIQPIIKDGIVYSDGDTILGADDKAGVAVIIEILRAASEHQLPLGPLELFFSIAEENGIKGSRYMDPKSLQAKSYYVLDGTGDPGEILTGGPATNKIDVVIHGRPAHAGICPEEGISAIEVISEAISQLNLGRISPVTTANIGIIQGGDATNIVCPEVHISAEVRSQSEDELKAQTEHMSQVIRETCSQRQATFDFEVDPLYKSFEVADDSPFLSYTKAVIEEMQLPFNSLMGGGGSDANHLSQYGITPIILGIGIKDCHTTDESIAVDTLTTSAEMCLGLLRNFWYQ